MSLSPLSIEVVHEPDGGSCQVAVGLCGKGVGDRSTLPVQPTSGLRSGSTGLSPLDASIGSSCEASRT